MRRIPIALAAVLLSGCSGGGHTSQPPPSSTHSGSTSISSSNSSPAPEPGEPGESEGGQREAEQQAREAEKQFYAQHVHPGGKPGQNFTDAQGPGTAKDWYCGVVDGNFAGKYSGTNAYTPNDISTATPAFKHQTGKWDIGIEDEEKWANKNNGKACPRALTFFADLLSTPENGMRVSISDAGVWYYDFQYARCSIDEGEFSRDDNSLWCALDKKDSDANTDVFVAFVR
jgi:hypothetical protein